jgi:hypothetical protein
MRLLTVGGNIVYSMQYALLLSRLPVLSMGGARFRNGTCEGFLDELESGALNDGTAKRKEVRQGKSEETAEDGFFVPNHQEDLIVRRERCESC